ncbi:unnamed protein product [Closterium sp. NIES-54]
MGDRAGQTCGKPHTQHRCFSRLDVTWRTELGDEAERPRWAELLRSGVAIFDLDYDAILAAMNALSSVLPGTAPAEALHNFTLDSRALRCFFRDSTTFTPLSAPVPVRLADPSGGPVLAHSSTVLPCSAVPSGSLLGLHLPSFSTNLVRTAALQDAMVTTTTPGGQRVSICTCTRTGRHLATFRRRPGSSLYTLATEPPQVASSAQVSASGLVAPPCLYRLLSHQTLVRHHRLGQPSLPLLHGMHSRLLVSGLPRSPPSLPPSPAQPCLPCVEGWQRAAPHSSSFPPTTAPLQTLHMDVWAPACVSGQGRERYFLLVVDDYTRYTSVFPLRSKGEVLDVLISWIRAVRLQLRERFHQDLPVIRLHSDRDGEFSSDLLPPQTFVVGRASSRRSHFRPHRNKMGLLSVDPLAGTVPVEVASDSGAARGSTSGGAASRGAEPGGAELGGVELAGVEPGGTTSRGAETRGTASSGGPAGAPPRLSPRPEPLSQQQLREWFAQRTRLPSGATGAGGAAVTTGAGGTGGAAAAGPGGAHTGGTGAAGAGGVGGAGAGDPTEPGATGAGAGAVDPGIGGAGAVDPGVLSVPSSTSLTPPLLCAPPHQSQPPLQPASPLPISSPYTEQTDGLTERHEPASRPASPVRTGRRVTRPCPAPIPGTHAMALRPSSVPQRVPLPPPPESSLPLVLDPKSDRACTASPTVSRPLTTVVNDSSFESTAASALVAELLDFAAACRLDYATALVAESESPSPPSVGGECALGMDVLEDRQEDFECLAAAVPRFASLVLAPEGDPDAPNIPTPRSYAETITGPYSSQWQAAMDAEMASWKSTGTYVDAVPPSRANIVDGMWIFRVKRPPGSSPAFKARYVARGFSQRQGVDYFQTFSPTPKMTTLRVLLHVTTQRDYELHFLDFSTAFLQGSLHEEIWLRRPPGFTRLFLARTQWSLWRPVYGLRQAPREWHNTLRTTLTALGFVPSTADPSLFLRTDTSLPPFYFLVYVNDFVFATADTEALTLVKSELQKRHTCTDLGELRSYLGLQITRDRARCTITLTQSHMVHQVLQRFGF